MFELFLKISLITLKDIFYFPIWWYSRGLAGFSRGLAASLADKEKDLAFFIWLRNIFTPMYAQSDFWGRLISFLMRVVQIMYKMGVLLAWMAVLVILFIGWIVLPVLIIYNIFFQISNI
jgi:hypothetical protein